MFGWLRRKKRLPNNTDPVAATSETSSFSKGAKFVSMPNPMAEGEPTAEQIVPRIKHPNFLAAVENYGAHGDLMPVTRPFIADLLIAYGFDLPGMFRIVREMDRKRLGLSMDAVHQVAMRNLRKQVTQIQRGGHGPVTTLSVGNDLEACLLLLDEVWVSACAELPGKLVVSVPHREMIMYTSSTSSQGISAMRQLAAEIRQQNLTHSLSEALLAWEGGKWMPFVEEGR